MRLDRFLAHMGYGSRKEVRQIIKSGKVTINGLTVKEESTSLQPGNDQVICQNELVNYREFIYLMLNKPAGVISATEDSRERTVLDLLAPQYLHKELFPVGRLDKDTEGLLILTNNGPLGHRLLSPKKHVPKQYYARIWGEVSSVDQQAFQQGILLEDSYQTLPAELEIIRAGEISEVMVVLHEGKFHQIKRMFQALDKRVLYLKRLSMGGIRLDPGLALGEYRELTAAEVALLSV